MYNKQLDAFIKAAELGSFSKAAAELFITPSSLIQQINLLENHLNLQLFHRSSRGVALTASGASIFEDAKNLVHLSKIAIERAQALEQRKRGSVKVATTLVTQCKYLMDIWSRAVIDYPQLKIELVSPQGSIETMTAKPLESLGTSIDLQEGIYLSGLYENRCDFLELFPAKLCIAVPNGHKLHEKNCLSSQDLHGEKIILARRGHSTAFDHVREFLAQEQCDLEIFDVDYFDINIFATCELNNYLMLSLDVWSNIYPSLKTCPVEWEFTIPYGLIYSTAPSKEVQILIDTAGSLRDEGYFNQ